MSMNSASSRARILTVGSMNMDLVLELERFPAKHETISGLDYDYVPGGKGGNQALAVARLGADSCIVAAVGSDSNGQRLIHDLELSRVQTRHISRHERYPTGLAVIPVDAEGTNQIMIFPGANVQVSFDSVLAALDEGHVDAILLQLEIPRDVVVRTIEEARKRGIPTILDAAPATDTPLEAFDGVTIISPNETECFEWTGIYPEDNEAMIAGARILLAKTNARFVVFKLGSRGAALYDRTELQLFPAFTNITAVDSTAAGDTFTAALAVRWCETDDLAESIRFANAAGALCVSKRGAQPSIPDRAEVDQFRL